MRIPYDIGEKIETIYCRRCGVEMPVGEWVENFNYPEIVAREEDGYWVWDCGGCALVPRQVIWVATKPMRYVQ